MLECRASHNKYTQTNTHYTKIIFLRLLANHDVKPMNDELNF